MSRTYVQLTSCIPSAYDNTYIYQIVPSIDNRLAAITSRDEVLVVDVSSLSSTAVSRIEAAPKALTTLSAGDQGRSLYCGDSAGHVSCFDVRAASKTGSLDVGRPVSALQCRGQDLAVGTEFMHQQAVVSVWDLRKNQIRWQNAENNDDITALDFHPKQQNLILVGGDDGLVSLFDVSILEEDESLVQAVNHSPIHKAGFLQSDAIYALSSDQNLALHPIYSPEREEELSPVLLGDLRPLIPCEYVIDVVQTRTDFAVAAGSHSKSRVDIVGIREGAQLDLDNRIVLEGAHGEEIVRSLLLSDKEDVIFTAGEDGQIKAFGTGADQVPAAAPKGSKTQHRSEVRYKPY